MALSKAFLNQQVEKAFGQMGDVRLTVTYTRVTSGAYDPATDSIINVTENVVVENCVGVRPNTREVEWFPADATTLKLLIAGTALPFAPTTEDYVTINGARWEVRRVSSVPGNSLWMVYIVER
jgi:uncharacterized cysteine cluster protein YcgN (CxxCxxCC family)